jgi:hypothetical protein
VLKPVKFHSSRNPRTQQTDQSWLYDFLIVEKIVPVGLVQPPVDSPSDLGENHEFDVFVLKENRAVSLFTSFAGNAIREGVRVDSAAASLVDPLFQEHWVLVWRKGAISRDYNRLFPSFYRCARFDNRI